MKTTTQCPGCTKMYLVPTTIIGKHLTCKKCSTRFAAFDFGGEDTTQSMLARLIEPPLDFSQTEITPVFEPQLFREPPPPLPQKSFAEKFGNALRPILRLILAESLTALYTIAIVMDVLMFCAWLGTMESPPGIFVLANYLSLFVSVFLLLALVRPQLPRHWLFQRTACVTAFTACVVWYQFDTYARRWSDGNTQYSDRTHRSGKMLSRVITRPGEWTITGPMKGDPPRPHGAWVEFGIDSRHFSWYWYGEEITQGEWVLRNR